MSKPPMPNRPTAKRRALPERSGDHSAHARQYRTPGNPTTVPSKGPRQHAAIKVWRPTSTTDEVPTKCKSSKKPATMEMGPARYNASRTDCSAKAAPMQKRPALKGLVEPDRLGHAAVDNHALRVLPQPHVTIPRTPSLDIKHRHRAPAPAIAPPQVDPNPSRCPPAAGQTTPGNQTTQRLTTTRPKPESAPPVHRRCLRRRPPWAKHSPQSESFPRSRHGTTQP